MRVLRAASVDAEGRISWACAGGRAASIFFLCGSRRSRRARMRSRPGKGRRWRVELRSWEHRRRGCGAVGGGANAACGVRIFSSVVWCWMERGGRGGEMRFFEGRCGNSSCNRDRHVVGCLMCRAGCLMRDSRAQNTCTGRTFHSLRVWEWTRS
ncbi:hypothetical protein C8R45DRAFT_1224480 [Mycena sanguinolenta]|nr:hypothetical protein C8R45DRAFT_1224480 [Mycena sanguinolenta]